MIYLLFLCSILRMLCYAERCLPPPTDLTYSLHNKLFVKVSWRRPTGLPEDCPVTFEIQHDNQSKRMNLTSHTLDCPSEGTDPGSRLVAVRTVAAKACRGWKESPCVNVTVDARLGRKRADLMEDFKCLVVSKGLNCSWLPTNRSHDPKLYIRYCGPIEGRNTFVRECEQLHSAGPRKVCFFEVLPRRDYLILMDDGDRGWRFLNPGKIIDAPEMTVKERVQQLDLSWQLPEDLSNCCWIVNLRHEYCKIRKDQKSRICGGQPIKIGYDRNCKYKFYYNLSTDDYCPLFTSEPGELSYGSDKLDPGLAVLAIVIPVILFICVILSCFCIRRHSDILCPSMPDPSAIFKEMMIPGTQEPKGTTENVYTPVPENMDSCKIVLGPSD